MTPRRFRREDHSMDAAMYTGMQSADVERRKASNDAVETPGEVKLCNAVRVRLLPPFVHVYVCVGCIL